MKTNWLEKIKEKTQKPSSIEEIISFYKKGSSISNKKEDGGSIEEKDQTPVKGENKKYKGKVKSSIDKDKSPKSVAKKINIPFGKKTSSFKNGGIIDYDISNILKQWKK